eukprot:4877531-Pleurochrysis_carterae.AAC.1
MRLHTTCVPRSPHAPATPALAASAHTASPPASANAVTRDAQVAPSDLSATAAISGGNVCILADFALDAHFVSMAWCCSTHNRSFTWPDAKMAISADTLLQDRFLCILQEPPDIFTAPTAPIARTAFAPAISIAFAMRA